MKIFLIGVGVLLVLVLVGYFVGQVPAAPNFDAELPEIPGEGAALTRYVEGLGAETQVREGNEAAIVWADSSHRKTEYSIVYLHGFGASRYDGDPVHKQVADSLGANLFLARWGSHGQVAPYQLDSFSAEGAWADAKEALAIGNALGEKTLIMSTSTGGTLALLLAATYPDRVAGLLNFSPNIKDDVPGSWLLDSPWGYELAHLVSLGDERKVTHEEPGAAQYFDTIFPATALVELQVLVGASMNDSTYARVTCPVLTLYYYKDAWNEDERVEIDVYPAVHAALGTPAGQQQLTPLATPGTHFIGCGLKSRDTEVVREAVLEFVRDVIHPRPPAVGRNDLS